jgi:two-component system nitrate/nitrite response regulator NarL
MVKTRVLLIEDNRLLRDGLTTMLNEQPDFEVVAGLGDADDVVSKVRELGVRLVLVDVGLPNQNSLHLVERLKKACPEAGIIVMDLAPVPADVIEFVKAGVSGFVMKDATFADFAATLRSVAAGLEALPADLAASIFSEIIGDAVRRRNHMLSASVRMTKREREVIELIAEGLSNKEIAQRLNLATHTVKSHVHNILEKLSLHTRLEVAAFAHNDRALVRD